ncbi:hypothetical protein K491DRAFT_732603 [Lophiostoma macrostomum CBS 122681]|uniref:DUF7587 domain-containing protein n=1 Tax=Lophiostoma macrostomum CBS 122681 TaxID=1314788 RepID=A0A6A6SQZ4_9PLEO|nr:hypothetical protein K491DRAFT_732603 [Lophiostoma macrostomum CBS 122681]
MEAKIDDIVGSVRNLRIAERSSQLSEPGHINSTIKPPLSVEDAVQGILQSTTTVNSQCQSFKSLVSDAISSGALPLTEVCLLRKGTQKLRDVIYNIERTVETLDETTERSIVEHLKSLGGQGLGLHSKQLLIPKLLSHFDEKIRKIVRKCFDDASNQTTLWKVAEKCYMQAIQPSGSLNADDYFIPLEEAYLEEPFDPDFESEEYYDHENRLAIDEGYAAVIQEEDQRRSKIRDKDRQCWVNFWVEVLHNAPDGPTLFYPPAAPSIKAPKVMAVPKYLFRTFDDGSSGHNDEKLIASIASMNASQDRSRTDILSLGTEETTKLLYAHLYKSCFGGDDSDNLMSWTSSLLFAVQYAIWRQTIDRRTPSNIKICMVCTNDFPDGQFMRDVPLLEAYRPTAVRLDDKIRGFFDFRLRNEDYYNGEYLSQGAVNISNRSCVVSLQQLINAGLYQLYPEFEEAEGTRTWAKRVRDLRQRWSGEHRTTEDELGCSGWADKPDEVRRYWIAAQAMESSDLNGWMRSMGFHRFPHSQQEELRKIYT